MIDIIQIYKSKEYFTKKTYTTENRNRFHVLEESFHSSQGFLENKTLVLPLSCKDQSEFTTSDLIIIQDINGWEPFLENKNLGNQTLPNWLHVSNRQSLISGTKTHFPLKQVNIPKPFELFKISKSDKETYELSLNYDSNSMTIGIPNRNNHKICDLKKRKPIRYLINGKSDFTLSRGKERTFYEFDYVIEWIGRADKIEFRELNITKAIPIDHCKVIDERKFLF